MSIKTKSLSLSGQDAEVGRTRPKVGFLIAFGCLVFGGLSGLGLVLGPLGGSQEPVVTGVVLICLGMGWAMIAVLSDRLNRSDQLWAYVPALVLSLTGLALVITGPDDGSLHAAGWVWPGIMAVLAVWVARNAHRHGTVAARRLVLYPVVGLMALAAIGGQTEMVLEAHSTSPTVAGGQLVDVGNHRLWIKCSGSGSPTVVLEPGLGETSGVMGWLVADIAPQTRVCVYDRAGRGNSDPAVGAQDGRAVAVDLHTLLGRAHIDGPYVLGAHSFGGLYALTFAHLYPDEVAGMALIDSTSPHQFDLPAYPGQYAGLRKLFSLLPSAARLGLARPAFMSAYGGLPPADATKVRSGWATATQARSAVNELAAAPAAMRQAAQLASLGDRPVVVLTAPVGAEAGWSGAQDALALLSTNSVHRVIAGASHAALLEDRAFAAQSSRAVRDVVDAVRTRQSLR